MNDHQYNRTIVLDSLRSATTRRLGLDLGTSRTRIWSDRGGILVDEPTALAVDRKTGKVLAVGQAAAEMEGRVAAEVVVHRPVQRGKLHNLPAARAMLQVWLQHILGASYVFSPVLMASVPASSSPAARAAMTELLYSLGAKEAYTIAQPLAAAIGAGVPIADASGSLVGVLGAGVVESALISLGSVVAHQGKNRGSNYLSEQIQFELQEQLQLRVSQEVALELLRDVAQVGLGGESVPGAGRAKLITGQDLGTRAPKEIQVQAQSLSSVVELASEAYVVLLQQLLSQLPPELTTDVLDKGMLLAGGLSQLQGLEEFLIARLGLPVTTIDQPEQAVIRGIGTALEHLDQFKHSVGYYHG